MSEPENEPAKSPGYIRAARVLAATGFVLVSCGVGLIKPEAGIIVAGAMLIVAGTGALR